MVAIVKNYNVKPISRSQCEPFILGVHYAKRWPSISWAFGLFRSGDLVGVCTFGTPASSPLRRGVAGPERSMEVIELNRLCLADNLRNEASTLVSRSLKLIPRGKIVVSFADTSQGHLGIVCQATNFLYCGLSAKRTDWKVKGKEHLHGQTIADEFRGSKNRVQAMRDKYGDDFYLAPRPRKHRYIAVIGSKKYIKKCKNDLRYKIEPYPKGTKYLTQAHTRYSPTKEATEPPLSATEDTVRYSVRVVRSTKERLMKAGAMLDSFAQEGGE